MIGALQRVLDDLAEGERRAAMWAAILERDRLARGGAEQSDALAAAIAQQRTLGIDLMRECDDIPGLAQRGLDGGADRVRAC